jgi:enoyl-CoA hydratase/carnithine racemase
MSDRIKLRKDGHVAWLTFNRPDRLNAMTIATWFELDDLLRAVDKDREVRCLILAGEGRAFLAGHDVGEIRAHNEDIEAGRLTPAQLREWQKSLQASTRLIRDLRCPVIAAVQGYAVGAGCEVVCACDLVVAGEDAKFGFPEVNIGVTITNGGTYYLPRKVGLAKARELAYLGEFIDAEEALAIGLVNRVVPVAELAAAAETLARRIASRGRGSAPQGHARPRPGGLAGRHAQFRDRSPGANRHDPGQFGRNPRLFRETRARIHRRMSECRQPMASSSRPSSRPARSVRRTGR